jgi:hypothetical protein
MSLRLYITSPLSARQVSLTVLRTMFSALQDNQEIKSSVWMIILSIIPSDLVRTGALLLGGTIVISHIVHAIRPRDLMYKFQMRLLHLEENRKALKATIDNGIMAEADANLTKQIERRFRRWAFDTCASQNLVDHPAFSSRLRYCVFELQERTLLTSRVLEEIKAVWRGQSFEIYECLWDVKALERELEVCWFNSFFLKAEILISLCLDTSSNGDEEPTLLVEVIGRNIPINSSGNTRFLLRSPFFASYTL